MEHDSGTDGGQAGGRGERPEWHDATRLRDLTVVSLLGQIDRRQTGGPPRSLDRRLLPPQKPAFDLPLTHVELFRDQPDADKRHE